MLAVLDKKQFKVSDLIRVTSSATFPDSVTPIKSDYTHASLVAAFKGQDTVVSMISTSNLTEQKRVVDASVEACVRRFIPSGFGWDTNGDVSLEMMPYMVTKKDPVTYLGTELLVYSGSIAATAFGRTGRVLICSGDSHS